MLQVGVFVLISSCAFGLFFLASQTRQRPPSKVRRRLAEEFGPDASPTKGPSLFKQEKELPALELKNPNAEAARERTKPRQPFARNVHARLRRKLHAIPAAYAATCAAAGAPARLRSRASAPRNARKETTVFATPTTAKRPISACRAFRRGELVTGTVRGARDA